ncbi:MAG: 4Fe-4S binding protein [Prevotellaceae bacterium]|jgi:NAD-dependent dihydropyrimidine dehydrogenase PreA subunit|nr:4Fe-4S binding protein [Prevotellaceae bacterium]
MKNNIETDSFWKRLHTIRQPKEIYVVADKCTGCKRCVNICRHHVLSMISISGNVYATACRQEHCSACGKCIAICPNRAIELVKQISNN